MEGKKRYVAIVLFLLIGLTVFTFANPVEEQKGSKGNGSNGSEVTDKEDNTSDGTLGPVENQNQNQNLVQVPNQNQGIGQTEAADTSYDDALEAVVRAEATFDELDIENARDLIEEVTNQNQKDELTERVDIIEEAIEAIGLVETLEKMVEDATKRDEIESSLDYRTDEEIIEKVDALRNEEVQQSLKDRLQILSRILDDNTAPKYDGVTDGETTNKDVSITYSDTDSETGTENEVTVTVTRDGEDTEFKDTFTEEGEYVVTLTDEAFNETIITFTIDKTAAKYHAVNANVNGYKNEVKTQYATNGNTVTAYISMNEELKENPTFKFYINGKKVLEVAKEDVIYSIGKNAEYPHVYTAKLKIDETTEAEDGEITFKVVNIVDKAGNKSDDIIKMTPTGKSLHLDRTSNRVTFTSIKTTNDAVRGNTYYVKNGDTITLRIGFREKLGTNAVVKIAGREATLTYVKYFAQPNHHEYTATLTIPADEKELAEGELSFTIENVTDELGNKGFYYQTNGKNVLETITKTVTTNGKKVVYDRTAPARVYSTVRVNKTEYNENGTKYYYVKNGDNFEFAISFNEQLSETPVVTIAGREVVMTLNEKVLKNENKVLYEGTFEIASDEKELKQGTLEIKVANVKDIAGNEATAQTVLDQTKTSNGRTVVYDCKNPVIEGVNNKYFYTKPITIKAVDSKIHNVSPIASATIDGEAYELGTEYAKEGTHEFVAYDRAGNRVRVTFTIDLTAPKLTVKEESVGTDPSYREVSFKLSDNLAVDYFTVNGVKFERTNAKWSDANYQDIKSALVEGANVIVLYDEAGNKTEKTFYMDWTAPTIELPGTVGLNKNEMHVESGTEVTLEDVLATVTDNIDATTKVVPYKADLLISSVASENVYNYDFTNGFNTRYIGRYNISYEVTDRAGNTSTATMLLVMTDTTPATITLPENGQAGRNQNEMHVESGTEVTLEDVLATVTDNVDETVKIAPYKADLLISGVASENTYNYDFSNGFDTRYVGRYNIYYTYTDKAGHITNKTMLLVMTDTTAPTIEIPGTAGLNKNEYIVEAGTHVTVEEIMATVTDNVDPTTKIKPYRADLLIGTASENTYNYDFTNGFNTNYTKGRYNLYYEYTDKAGHKTTAGMMIMIKDTTAPTLEITRNKTKTYVRGNDLFFIVYNVYKNDELVHTVDSEISAGGNYFSVDWLGHGNYRVEAIDRAGNKTVEEFVVDGTYYINNETTLKEAIMESGRYVLSADITLVDSPLIIAKGKEVEIDLNGKTITGRSTNASASKLITVSEGATLKLTGEGTIDFTAGKPDTNWGGEGQLPFPGYSSNTISNIGKLIVDGPTLINNTARGGASYVIDNYQGSELIVKSGKIHQTGGDQALRIFANSNTLTTSLTVEGGEIIGRRALWIQLPNTDATRAPKVNVNITGGVLRSNDTGATGYNIAIYSYSYGESFKNVNVNITGGEFFGHVAFGGGSKNGQENVNVTGGVFHNDLGRYLAGNGWEDIAKPE